MLNISDLVFTSRKSSNFISKGSLPQVKYSSRRSFSYSFCFYKFAICKRCLVLFTIVSSTSWALSLVDCSCINRKSLVVFRQWLSRSEIRFTEAALLFLRFDIFMSRFKFWFYKDSSSCLRLTLSLINLALSASACLRCCSRVAMFSLASSKSALSRMTSYCVVVTY